MRFDDIIGNDAIKVQLTIASHAAKIGNLPVPHTLFAGAAGCGKTSMSKALALDLNSEMVKAPPESIRTAQDVVDLSEKFSVEGYTQSGRVVGQTRPTILFLDEIHKMPLSGQESLGIAMEEWYVAVKSKYTRETVEYWLPKFTVVGATTESGKLSKPFRDRFKLSFHFSTYDHNESCAIVAKHAELKNVALDQSVVVEIANRGRGVPRILVGLLERIIDTHLALRAAPPIGEATANIVFKLMGIDKTGLLYADIAVLKCLYEAGIPVGAETLSVIINESQETLQRGREPYLMQRGLLIRSGRGRLITQKGVEYLRENGHIESKRRFSHG